MIVETLTDAERLHLEYKREWAAKIRWRITERLVDHGRFHAEDLLSLEIPEDCRRSVVGTCISAAVTQCLMEETGERYSTGAAQGHGRRSALYRITDRGRDVLPARLAARRERLAAAVPPEPVPLFDAGAPDATASTPYYRSEEAA